MLVPLGQMDPLGRLDPVEHLVQLEAPDSLVKLDHLDLLDHQVLRELLARQANQVHLVLLDQTGNQDPQVFQVSQELQGDRGALDQLAIKEIKVPLVLLDLPDLLDHQGLLDLLEVQAFWDHRVQQDQLGPLDHLVSLVHQDRSVNLVQPDP